MRPATPPLAWQLPPEVPTLTCGEVDVWRASVHVGTPHRDQLAAWLTAEEWARADRFRRPVDQLAFVVRRGVLRRILGTYLGADPAAVPLATDGCGKPFVAGTNLRFNLSHSGPTVVYAVARGREVGIDVETVTPSLDPAPPSQFLSLAERRSLAEISVDERPRAFLACWTRKEAVAKACGRGVSLPFDRFSVTVPPEPARLIDADGHPGGTSRWWLRDLDLGGADVAALASEGPLDQLRYLQFDPSLATAEITASDHCRIRSGRSGPVAAQEGPGVASSSSTEGNRSR